MQSVNKIIFLGLLFSASCGGIMPDRVRGPVNKQTDNSKPSALVVGISDGDTITVRFGDNTKQQRIRLATIDAPEFNQPFGKKSKQSLSDLVYNKRIELNSSGSDKYGRMVAEVFVEGNNINIEQIRRGLAWHYVFHARQQTGRQRSEYSAAEQYAKGNNLGLWIDKKPIPPWDYREQNKKKNGKARKYNSFENYYE